MCPGRGAYVGSSRHSAGDVLYVEAKFHGTETAIILGGEFDMTGTERFWVLSAKYSGPAASVEVEARGLTFIDSSGLMALRCPR